MWWVVLAYGGDLCGRKEQALAGCSTVALCAAADGSWFALRRESEDGVVEARSDAAMLSTTNAREGSLRVEAGVDTLVVEGKTGRKTWGLTWTDGAWADCAGDPFGDPNVARALGALSAEQATALQQHLDARRDRLVGCIAGKKGGGRVLVEIGTDGAIAATHEALGPLGSCARSGVSGFQGVAGSPGVALVAVESDGTVTADAPIAYRGRLIRVAHDLELAASGALDGCPDGELVVTVEADGSVAGDCKRLSKLSIDPPGRRWVLKATLSGGALDVGAEHRE